MADGLKDRNLQDYYESLQAMFPTKGWKYLAEDLETILAAAITLDDIDSMEALHFRRGQVDILKKLLAQEQMTGAAYDILLEQEQ
jgi:hypothetical protein